MTAVAITANNTRVEDCEALTGWSNIGGGAGGAAEPAFAYQGGNLVNRKVTSSTGAGLGYAITSDGGVALDITSGNMTLMAKVMASDYGGLQLTNGLEVRVGSSGSDYYDAVVAGTNSPVASAVYPDRGGLVIMPVNFNVAAYRDSTSGSPVLTSVDFIGFLGAFSLSTAKSENVGMDALDFGVGLTLTGGDGADPDGVLQDFVDADEGTVNNRWGYAYKVAPDVHGAFGMWTMGTSVATVMNDAVRQTIIFSDGLFAAGFSGITADIQNAVSSISISNKSITGLGNKTTEDSRPVFIGAGTAGASVWANNVFTNFASLSLTSAFTLTGGSIIGSDTLTQAGAIITGVKFDGPTVLTGVAAIISNVIDSVTGCQFISGGAGHAVELTAATGLDVNWNGNTLSGYSGTSGSNLVASSGSLDAALYNNSGKAITLNILNGATVPSIRNGAGSTTTVVAGLLTLTVTGLLAGESEVRVRDGSVTLNGGNQNPVAGGTFQMTFAPYASANRVTLSVSTKGYEYINKTINLFNVDVTENLILDPDASWVP